MSQSMVHISSNDTREYYFNAFSKKIAEFKNFQDSLFTNKIPPNSEKSVDIKRLLNDAISFKDMFDIKSASFSLTRDDVNLIVRILNTSA